MTFTEFVLSIIGLLALVVLGYLRTGYRAAKYARKMAQQYVPAADIRGLVRDRIEFERSLSELKKQQGEKE